MNMFEKTCSVIQMENEFGPLAWMDLDGFEEDDDGDGDDHDHDDHEHDHDADISAMVLDENAGEIFQATYPWLPKCDC